MNGPAVAGTKFIGSCIRSAGGKATRGGRVRRPGLTAANSFANGRKCLTEEIVSLHWHGLLALGLSARKPRRHTGSRGLDSARSLLPELTTYFVFAGFCVNLS